MTRGLVLAAPGSSSGKTSLCAALAWAMGRRGAKVQTFKVGPDYIDPSYLSAASGRECWNLDGFLTPGLLPWIYRHASCGADVALVEGVMGLYDGLNPKGDFSTAWVAWELGLPVVLVLDCLNASPTLGAMAWGLVNAPGAPEIRGMILNRIAGPSHGEMVRAWLEPYHLPPVLGQVQRHERSLPSRHLGLCQAFEGPALMEAVRWMGESLDPSLLQALEGLAEEPKAGPLKEPSLGPLKALRNGRPLRVALARDRAFSFVYQSSLFALESMGAEIVPFSPVEEEIPEGVHGLILPGGYPEEHMDRLSLSPFIGSLRRAREAGMPTYGECGGMMVLGERMRDPAGRGASMGGLLRLGFDFKPRLQRFGYVECRLEKDCLVGGAGTLFRAHEFHYSFCEGPEEPLMEVRKASDGRSWRCGYGDARLFASYAHVDMLGEPHLAERFLSACALWAEGRQAARPKGSTPRVRKRGRALMVLGASSDAGKSFLATGLCRVFARRGLRVNPFKAQNMALNAFSTPWGEMGTAQAVQAEAAGVEPSPLHNPVLLKPMGDSVSQVIVKGRVLGHWSAGEYHRNLSEELFPLAAEALSELLSSSDLVVMEGAGSPAEMNLYHKDLVNLRMARFAEAFGILAADIERGGVFAALWGTLDLVHPMDRPFIGGLVVNRFRGDPSLFDQGVRFLEKRTGRPVLGVLPLIRDLSIPAEDSLNRRDFGQGELRAAVISLPRMSNFTDFDALGEDRCRVVFASHPGDIRGADLVIIPGTKTTLEDLRWLKAMGFPKAIGDALEDGAVVWGICGGYQMLGLSVEDPLGVEGGGFEEGLRLLPVRTVFRDHKVARPASAAVNGGFWLEGLKGACVKGYEIHAGETSLAEGGTAPLTVWDDGRGRPDGAFGLDGRVFGSYLHGLADDPVFRRALLNFIRRARGLPELRGEGLTGRAMRERRYDALADFLEERLRMDVIEGAVFPDG
ncbi:MAG: cobyric acid synthase [Thermanaerothrix sp.]|nr:cobyric acid synthase [Thermanaerothrix sp.]